MSDVYLNNWLRKADNDLKIVEHELELEKEEIVTDAACFHCQQAVEKYLKAFLIYCNVQFPRTHSIEYLLGQASLIDPIFADIDIKELSDFGVQVRYPDDYYIPTPNEVNFYYKLALQIKRLVLSKIEI